MGRCEEARRSKEGIGRAQGGIGRAPRGSPKAILAILLHKISHFFGLTPGPKPTENVPMNTESTLCSLIISMLISLMALMAVMLESDADARVGAG